MILANIPVFFSIICTGKAARRSSTHFHRRSGLPILPNSLKCPLHSLALFVSVCRHHRSLADPEELLLPPRELTGPHGTTWNRPEVIAYKLRRNKLMRWAQKQRNWQLHVPCIRQHDILASSFSKKIYTSRPG